MESIRADEEALGGIIHKAMYERLLLAEIVVADLTFANANVFYELGIRHAARPRSTILIYAKLGQPPFDVAPIRAIPYEIGSGGEVIDPDALRTAIEERLELAKEGKEPDSPLFQLLSDYPGIELPGEATEAFRERARWISDLTIRANDATRERPEDAKECLAKIEDEIDAARGAGGELLLVLMLSYRAIEAWDDVIRLAKALPAQMAELTTVREQLALALSRRAGTGDRRRAVAILEELLDQHGDSSETPRHPRPLP
ncbi:MAG TPA: TRAFs-binding domain-containing protein [Solirubrobacterales bacterium]|nr:TRAFs-binding domain-containing protein [Solirubrobacterales bacterium]